MFRYFSAVMLAALAAPLSAQTEADLEWSRYFYTSFEPSDLGLAISYGLPESDLEVMRANCMDPGQGETNIRGSFSAVLGDAINGLPILLEFEGLTGGLPVVSANAAGVGSEFGITGAMVEFPTSDRLWDHLAQAETLRYRVRGQEDWAEYPGDPAMFSAFRAECSRMGSAFGAEAAVPAPDACVSETDYASVQTGDEIAVEMTNQTDRELLVYWLDESGTRVEMGTLPAGQSADLGTRMGHNFLVTELDGTCLDVHAAADGPILLGPAAPQAPRTDSK